MGRYGKSGNSVCTPAWKCHIMIKKTMYPYYCVREQYMKTFEIKHTKKQIGVLTLLAAALLPLILLLLCFARKGMIPFGDISILHWDQLLQYKDYYGYLWDVLHGNAGLSYSFSKSLGGGMIGTIAYYVSSLSNILLLFFDKNQIPQYLSFAYALKTLACGLTMCLYIQYRQGVKPGWVILLSLSYAFMEYNVDYCRNLMWIDGAVMLPLICLGVWFCLRKKHLWLLPFAVGISVICNWYTGYMNCVAACVYLCYEAAFADLGTAYGSDNGHSRMKGLLRTLSLLLLGIGASMIILLPTGLSMMGSDKASFQFSGAVNMTPAQMLAGFAIHAPYNTPVGPPIYTGGLCLLLVVYALWSDRIPLRVKLGYLFLLTVGFCSFIFHGAELIWTAFHESFSYFYRFSYVFSFLLLVISSSAVSFGRLEGKRPKPLAIAGAAVTILAGYFWLVKLGSIENLPWNHYAMGAIIIYAALLMLLPHSRIKYWIILPLLCMELGKNALLSFSDFSYRSDTLQNYNDSIGEIITELTEKENQFFRLEKNFSYLTTIGRDVADCESTYFGYRGLELYLSTYDWRVNNFLNRIGYSNLPGDGRFPCEMYWNDSLPIMESILSVKYVLSNKALYGYEPLVLRSDEYLPDGYQCYINQRWLPLAFGMYHEFEDFDWVRDPFENQNRFISELTGIREPLYQPVQFESDDGPMEEYTLVCTEDGPLYLFVDGESIHPNYYEKNCTLYVNGEVVQDCCSRFVTNSMYLGDFAAGERVKLSILHKSGAVGHHTLYAYRIDKSVYDRVFARLSEKMLKELKVEEGAIHMESSFDDETTVFFSVPYERGWKCQIDGKSVQPGLFGETFLILDIPAGEHRIFLKYEVPGLKMGAAISVISMFIILWLFLFEKRGRRKLRKQIL